MVLTVQPMLENIWINPINSCNNYTILAPDIITADVYGSIKSKLKNKGKQIPENGIWIAAIAIQFNLPLFTTDKHFQEVDNIVIVEVSV